MKKQDTIGSRLRQARLNLGLTYDEAYADLKIHPKVLQALEEDKVNPKIGDIYVKGFIKKYADFLGFEGEKVLSEFLDGALLVGQKKEGFIDTARQKRHLPLIIKNRFQHSALPLATTVAIVFTVFVIGYAGVRLIGELRKIGSAPPETASTSKPAEPANPEKVKKAVPSRVAAAPVAKQPLLLKVETTDKVWLRVKSDGKVVFEHTLAKGSVEEWQAKNQLELWVGRGEALDLTVNKKHIGSPGSGRIRRIVIDQKGFRVEKK